MIFLALVGALGVFFSALHVLYYVDDTRRERRRQRALDSLRHLNDTENE
jgi:hypothetical protein